MEPKAKMVGFQDTGTILKTVVEMTMIRIRISLPLIKTNTGEEKAGGSFHQMRRGQL